jgi:hypothetical protein
MDRVVEVLSQYGFYTVAILMLVSSLIGAYQEYQKAAAEREETVRINKSLELERKQPQGAKSLKEKQNQLLKERLEEINRLNSRLTGEVKFTSLSNNLILAGEYLVGGILTTSFIQESLPRATVGWLGLLVLIATLIHQRYRPETRIQIARSKLAFLRSKVRKCQDELVKVEKPDYLRLIGVLTRALDQTENWQMEEATSQNEESQPTGVG